MDTLSRHIAQLFRAATDTDAVGWEIGSAALTGVLLEVSVHPKPGLVTPRSMGSHRDMNLLTFMLSSAAIAPCLFRCAEAGRAHQGEPAALLPEIRRIGRHYDERLALATHGVNTQRGMLFSSGVLCAAAGLLSREQGELSAQPLFAMVSRLTQGLCARELENGADAATAGCKLYQAYGVRGIRGEVEDGFPTVASYGLPALKAALEARKPLNGCLLHALIAMIAHTQDTTVLWRSGPEGLAFLQSEAQRILALGGALSNVGMEAIAQLNRACIARNISPGGSADLLAVVAAAYLLENKSFSCDIVEISNPGKGLS